MHIYWKHTFIDLNFCLKMYSLNTAWCAGALPSKQEIHKTLVPAVVLDCNVKRSTGSTSKGVAKARLKGLDLTEILALLQKLLTLLQYFLLLQHKLKTLRF